MNKKEEARGIIINTNHLTPEQKEEMHQALIKDMHNAPIQFLEPEINKTEVLNIFNELLSEWYWNKRFTARHGVIDIVEGLKLLEEEKADYIKQFKKSLGVE